MKMTRKFSCAVRKSQTDPVPPVGEVSLHQQVQIVSLPDREASAVQNSAIGITAKQPKPPSLRIGSEFRVEQRSELDERKSAGERFGNSSHERRGDRSQQQESPVAPSIVIDGASQPQENLRPCLRFVEHHELRPSHCLFPLQIEPQAIGFLLQVEVSAAEAAGQRRLAALTGPDQGDGRKGAEAGAQKRGCLPGEH